ncbi:MAG: pseudouridine synthase [Neisseriaceae bacterium]|nr:pseudouridine synthase [Neisseriaceae bacterium]
MLIAFNKPYGVICQFSQDNKHPTLKDYINIPRIYPAGRLDTDSEGLLLLTDDGSLQNRITQPNHHLQKTYWAQVEGIPSNNDLIPFRQTMDLGDFIARPAQAKIIDEPTILWQRTPPIRFRKTIPDSWLEIKISEGKNRQVRRMCAKVGFPCLRLIRVGIGKLSLFDLSLSVGEFCQINTNDVF